jgi:hypothetical protein
MSEDMGQAFEWDGEIEVSDNEFELIPDGDYRATVVAVERMQHNGSEKMAPCPIANVKVRLDNGRILSDRIFLNSKSSWKIAQFFIAVGMRNPSATKEERLRMDWMGAIGRTCTIKVGNHEYKNKTYNEISEWVKPEAPAPVAPAPVMAAPAAPAPAPQNVVPATHTMQQQINQSFTQAHGAPVQSTYPTQGAPVQGTYPAQGGSF